MFELPLFNFCVYLCIPYQDYEQANHVRPKEKQTILTGMGFSEEDSSLLQAAADQLALCLGARRAEMALIQDAAFKLSTISLTFQVSVFFF